MNTQEVPLDILDLIPWRPSPPPPHEDAFHLDPHIWSQLPAHLLHSVLALLPFQSVVRFRCVCKQWKALFASPVFHHFASYRAHVPPLIFFFGIGIPFDEDSTNNDAMDNSDGGHVYEEGYANDVPDCDLSDECMFDVNDEGSHDVNGYVGHDRGDGHSYDLLMGGDEHGGVHDVMRYGNHGNIEQRVIRNVMRDGDHWSVPDVMRYGDQDLNDVMRYGDHGDMYDVIRFDDLGDMHDDDRLAIRDADDNFRKCHVNDQEAPQEQTESEPLLLIFDCESESWRSPLALPPGFRKTSNVTFIGGSHVCTFEEQLLIPAISPNRFFLFNPASPPFKELPPCIAIQGLEALGFGEERATLPGDVTLSNPSSLHSMSHEKDPHAQDKSAKILQIVAVGDTFNDTNIVESFDSVSGSWHVIGRLPQSDDFICAVFRMMYCKGCFYARLPSGIIRMSNVRKGQNMEWSYHDNPDPPYRDGDLSGRQPELIDQHVIATKELVFMVGVTVTYPSISYVQEDLDILIWQFHPDAPNDACWELLANMPSRTRVTFIGESDIYNMSCLAHGDLIFFNIEGGQRFLIYDLPRKLWRFSAKCKYVLDLMPFLWEPLLRN